MRIPAWSGFDSRNSTDRGNGLRAPLRFAERQLWNIRPASGATLLRLDVGGPDHLGPFFGFAGDELAQFGRRHRHRRPAEFDETCLKLGIGEGGIDLFVELADDLGRRALRCAEAKPE